MQNGLETITHEETQEFAKDVLNHMRERLSDYQETYGDLYNLEATPAESTTYRLAKYDKKQYPGIITAGREGETPYYTNSSHLPVGYTSDVFEALDIQDELQTLYTSGTVFHAFLGEKLPDWKRQQRWYERSHRTTNCRIIRFLQPIRSAKNMVILQGNILPVLTVEKKQRFTAGSPVIIVRFRTGTMERRRNTKSGNYEIGPSKLSEVKTNIVTISKDEVKVEPTDNIRYLFTTKTCPNCAAAKKFWAKKIMC